MFEVTIYTDSRRRHRLGHPAKLLHCDWGPGILSRAIDVTGLGDKALGLPTVGYPTGAWGVARELR